MTLLDWAIVILINGAVIAHGFVVARRSESSSDWFLAGRQLPWWALGLSMFATSVDNADLLSVSGFVYNNGLHILTVFSLAAVLGSSLAAFVIAPVLSRAGCYTNAEYLEQRFGPGMRLFSALIQVQYRTAVLGLMIWSVHLMLMGVVGLPSWASWATIVLLVSASAAYTSLGGLASVVWTDVLQSLVIMAGGLCLFGSVWLAVGGWSGLQERLQTLPDPVWSPDAGWIAPTEANPESANLIRQPLNNWLHVGRFESPDQPVAPLMLVLGWIIVGLAYYTVNHTQTVRLIAARSERDMQLAAVFGSLLGIPLMLITVLLGVFGRALYPELTAQGGKADELFPLLAADYLTPGLRGVVIAAILCASLSTFDSIGSALAALVTRDIYARWIKPNRDERHYASVSRRVSVGILVIGFLYIPFIALKRNMVDTTLSLIPVFITPLFTVYLLGATTRVHRRSGMVGLLTGGLFGLICLAGRELSGFEWLPWQLTNKWHNYPLSVLITASAMGITTLLLGRSEPVDTLPEEAVPSLEWWQRPGLYAVAATAFCLWLTFVVFW